jgi:aquaporin TIP
VSSDPLNTLLAVATDSEAMAAPPPPPPEEKPAPEEFDVLRRAAAEFVGTFALVFVGAGSVLVAAPEAGAGNLEIALAHGLVIAVMASAVGHISGGHFNPAVTLGFLVTGRLSPVVAGAYWVAQFLSAVVAAVLLRWIFSGDAEGTLGSPAVGPGIEPEAALIIEAILTFFLVWVIFATAADPRGTFKSIAGLAIGLTITLDALMAGPLTGAAMNPARAFGPQLLSTTWDEFWIWYIGPLAGGVLGALAYEWLYLRPLRPPVVGPPETGVVEPRPGDTALS